jgi:hypothetical protein
MGALPHCNSINRFPPTIIHELSPDIDLWRNSCCHDPENVRNENTHVDHHSQHTCALSVGFITFHLTYIYAIEAPIV